MNQYTTVKAFVETHAEWEKEFFRALITICIIHGYKGTNDVLYKNESNVIDRFGDDEATRNWKVWGQVMHDAVAESQKFPKQATDYFLKPEDVEKFLLKKNREYWLEAFQTAEYKSKAAEETYMQLMGPWGAYMNDLKRVNLNDGWIHHSEELPHRNYSEFIATMQGRAYPRIMR